MQINTLGFPSGAGMQSASATGGTGLGFVDALGFALDPAGQIRTGLIASATPPAHFSPQLAQKLLATAQLAAQAQPAPATGILPGLQQPTSMSELMATAAKLPAADQVPVEATAPATIEQPVLVAAPATPSAAPAEVPASAPAPAPLATAAEAASPPTPGAVSPTTPEAVSPRSPALSPATIEPARATAPIDAAPESATPAPVAVPAAPTKNNAELPPEGDTLPDALVSGTPAEAAPPKPQKGPRGRTAAADADVATRSDLPADAKPAAAAEMLAINVVPQQVAQQQQATPREASASSQSGSVVVKAVKVAASAALAQDGTQVASGTGTADFARAVAAKSESAGSESNADRQPQPETIVATAAKADAAAPAMPQQAHGTAPVDPVRATAPAAAAEPVIEARTGHIGHSLGVEIARKVELGEETLRIRLNPIELGRIEVTLAFDDKGSLQATVRTESAQAMDLLRQDTPDLARTLDQAGVRTDAQSFRFENRGGDSGGQQAQQQSQHSNRGQFTSSDDDAGAADPIYRPIRSDGQVDLLA